jgi:phytoene dehydrogenase-like protein
VTKLHDAVVVGAGPNGLVAANVLADAGWSVVVLEAQPTPGGAVRTEDLTAPGFHHDVFSAFYPMAAASPVMRSLQLDRFGLRWTHAPAVLAHVRQSAPAAVLHRRVEDTVAGLAARSPHDAAAYAQVADDWHHTSGPFIDFLLRPFPPVGPALRLLGRTGLSGARDLARLAIVSLNRFVEEEFEEDDAPLLFAGNALHADLTPEAAGSALFGWLLVGLAQQVGFPVPVGGACRITDALVARAAARGVRVVCGQRADRVVLEGGRAVAVHTATGDQWAARRAVLADCDATVLLRDLVGEEHLPAAIRARIGRIQRASSTIKVDWALSGPVPWADRAASAAGTVHVAESLHELTMTSAELSVGAVPAKPFLLVGQMTTADPSRSPAGTEALWAYTHVPQVVRSDAGGDAIRGRWDDHDVERFTDRVERRIEDVAPGFRDLVLARHVLTPGGMQARDANLVGGDISGGTAQLHQQLVFRPFAGTARAEIGVPGLYLASASAHPGGAVHGACGSNAARAALLHDMARRPSPRRVAGYVSARRQLRPR